MFVWVLGPEDVDGVACRSLGEVEVSGGGGGQSLGGVEVLGEWKCRGG